MSTSLLDLALNLLLGVAASVGQTSTAAEPGYLPTPESKQPTIAVDAEVRRQGRAARVRLTDPYYSFSRTRRTATRD